MTVGPPLRSVLVGFLLVAAIGAAAAPGEATTIPGAAVNVRAAMVQERRALRALPQGAGSSSASYARPLAHVHAATSDLLAVQAALADAARATGTFPHITSIQGLLNSALAGTGSASTQLTGAVWYIDHGVPAGSTVVTQARSDLRQALRRAPRSRSSSRSLAPAG